MDDSQTTPISAWLAFSLAFDANARLVQHLREHNRDPAAAGQHIQQYLQGDTAALSKALLGQLDHGQLLHLSSTKTRRLTEIALQWQQAHPTHHLIGLDHPRYPALLLDTANPPPLLYLKGDISALEYPALAIVGSRKASRQSIELTRKLAASMAQRQVAIVSGLARGIDAAAHQGALDVGGRTIAIAATEPDSVYPKCHVALAQQIIDGGGLIVTEYPLATPTLRWHFPRRNRIISGISLGVLVAEAGLPSGTLTTATHAVNQGREVLAIPGSVQNPQARGCHALIKQGATLVENEQDILDALAWPLLRKLTTKPDDELQNEDRHDSQEEYDATDNEPEHQILAALSVAPASADDLMTHTDLSVSQLSTLLSLMEIEGKVVAGAGGRYTRCLAKQ